MDNVYKEKLSNLSMLIQLARADKNLDDIEIEFYLRVAKRLGVFKEDYEKVFHGGYEFTPPKNEVERVVLFHSLVILAYIDDKIEDSEIHFCYELGLKLGLNTSAVRDILTKLKEEPKVAIDPKRVDKVFKSFLN
jgi:hypothetical protein